MTGLLQPPRVPRIAGWTYQLHEFAPDGGVLRSRSIPARNDGDTERQADELTEWHRTELWVAGRLVAGFVRAAGPVATAIKDLDEPTAIGP